ncbi:Crp/Fnr family transcriptional regulator [Allomuricauda taeanensis]|uniref:Crp/Fnr family transcriptional regulator n=1 Tax=Flagellimonas taeanensis TaxID=1005926 RepID=UPI002E7C038B|nr:Crp/Fnr family transcriptional regulator [Allomuricauda taeanensis]MEE1963928.1 Crp/Fnr family transcriptional regulator [Allomuricauda taeanensis]
MKKEVENIINEVFPISAKSFGEIERQLEYETHPKGETFVSRNKQNEKEYFVLNGICKSYLINPEGEEITIGFFLENSIISPHSTRTSNNISSYYLKALTDVELATINAGEFERLMIENVEIRNFGNTVLQNELMLKIEKEIGLASLSAKERLIEFRKKYKTLENLVPHTDIASYLGITNISLSRLRRDL